MKPLYNFCTHLVFKMYRNTVNPKTVLVSFLVLILTPVYGQNSIGDDAVERNIDQISQHYERLPQSYDQRNVLQGMYAQVIEEEVLVEPDSHDSDPDYKTGYYGTKDWQAFVAIYLWGVGMNGETGQGNAVADVDVSFGDIWDNLDIGGQAHFEFWWKKWIFFLDPLYMKLSGNSSQTRVINSIRSKVEIKMFLMDLAMGYRVGEFNLRPNTQSNNFKTWPRLSVDLYGGGRILSVDNTINLTLETPIGQNKQKINIDESWFDFIIGTRLIFDFTENLLLSIKTDIGGFGLGFSSDIDWNFTANVGYQLPWWGITPYIGYRVLYIDYKDGSGDNRFVYDIWHTGPQVGLGVRF